MAMFSMTARPHQDVSMTAQSARGAIVHAATRPIAAAYRSWRRWRTEKVISELSAETLKDIGYPSAHRGGS